jgi:hypothetical protein
MAFVPQSFLGELFYHCSFLFEFTHSCNDMSTVNAEKTNEMSKLLSGKQQELVGSSPPGHRGA